MRKFLIRWWFTADWSRALYERSIVLWNVRRLEEAIAREEPPK